MKKHFSILFLFAALALPMLAQGAAVTSNVATVTLNSTINESLTVAVAGGPLTLDLVHPNTPTANAVVTFNWQLSGANHTTGFSYGVYFSSANALTGPANVLASSIAASNNGGGMQACSATFNGQSNACGTGFGVKTQADLTANPTGTQNTNLTFQYTGTSVTMPGAYTGVANIVALAP